MRKHGYTGGELVMVMGGFVLLSISTAKTFVFDRARDNARRASCQVSSLKQMSLGIMAYVQDYDGLYPLTRGKGVPHDPGFGWAGSEQIYLKSTQVLHCPSVNDPPAPDSSYCDFTDYWYNSRVAGQNQVYLKYVANTFLFGDGNDGHDITDGRYNKSQLAADWYTDTSKPTFRHLGGANYAFLDGHIKWLRPELVTTAPASMNVYTFAT